MGCIYNSSGSQTSQTIQNRLSESGWKLALTIWIWMFQKYLNRLSPSGSSENYRYIFPTFGKILRRSDFVRDTLWDMHTIYAVVVLVNPYCTIQRGRTGHQYPRHVTLNRHSQICKVRCFHKLQRLITILLNYSIKIALQQQVTGLPQYLVEDVSSLFSRNVDLFVFMLHREILIKLNVGLA